MKTHTNENNTIIISLELLHSENIEPLWHPLGFVSCILKEEKDEIIKLHYWPKGERKTKVPNWPIHNHAYDIESTILYGEIKNIFYTISESGPYKVYEVIYDKKNSYLKEKILGKVNLNKKSELISKKGDSYTIKKHNFHESIIPLNQETLTLVRKTNFTKTAPRVISSKYEKKSPEYYHRSEFNKDLFFRKVNELTREK